MTTATKEKQSLLEEFGIKYDAVNRLADTIEIHHQKAYTEAALKHLKDKEGNLDYKMLKKAEVRTAMANQMADYYTEEAHKYFKIDPKASKLSDMQKEMLINAYAGITRGQLHDTIHKSEDDFTLPEFSKLVVRIKQRIGEQLGASAYAHIQDKPEHKKAILKELGLEGKVDTELLRVDELHALMEAHHQNGGVISPKSYQKFPAYIAMQGKHAAAPAHK